MESCEVTGSHCREGERCKSYSPFGNRDYYVTRSLSLSAILFTTIITTLINPDSERKDNRVINKDKKDSIKAIRDDAS